MSSHHMLEVIEAAQSAHPSNATPRRRVPESGHPGDEKLPHLLAMATKSKLIRTNRKPKHNIPNAKSDEFALELGL